jgi:ferritin
MTNPLRATVTPLHTDFAEAVALQISFEKYSELLYWRLSASMDLLGLKGASKYFQSRYNEERTHAEKFFSYLLDKQVNFNLAGIEPILVDIRTLKSAFEAALTHELRVTQSLISLYEHPNVDPISKIFLQWFLQEQIEEESSLKNILDRIEQASDNSGALLLIDHELSA